MLNLFQGRHWLLPAPARCYGGPRSGRMSHIPREHHQLERWALQLQIQSVRFGLIVAISTFEWLNVSMLCRGVCCRSEQRETHCVSLQSCSYATNVFHRMSEAFCSRIDSLAVATAGKGGRDLLELLPWLLLLAERFLECFAGAFVGRGEPKAGRASDLA